MTGIDHCQGCPKFMGGSEHELKYPGVDAAGLVKKFDYVITDEIKTLRQDIWQS